MERHLPDVFATHHQPQEAHHGEVWALAVSHLGDFIVSGGHDRCARLVPLLSVHGWQYAASATAAAALPLKSA